MIKREFTKREKLMLLALAIVLLGIFYYMMVVKYSNDQIASLQAQEMDVEDSISMEQVRAVRKADMESYLATDPEILNGEIKPYNNLQNELNALNDILQSATEYSVSFENAEVTDGDTIVRRPISVSFEAGSYQSARNIINELRNCKYRCQIRDLNITAESTNRAGFNNADTIAVDVTITFFETTEGAEDLSGLVTLAPETETTDTENEE